MEEGLFSRLQSYFSASYGGRFVECLIKESVEEQPKLSTLLFGVKASDRPSLEYHFKVGKRSRRADLAFLDAATLEPTCLIELKYDDQKSPGNASQVDDYLKFCRKQGKCKFILLSQHHLPRELLEKLPEKGARLLFSDIADKLRGNEDSVAGMLRRFFIDRGLVMHKFQERDIGNLTSFAFRLLAPWGGQGRSQNKDAMSGGVAEAFGYLLKNMNIVTKEVAMHENGRAPTVDFYLEPRVNSKQVHKEVLANPGEEWITGDRFKAGGCLYVFGRIRLDDRSGHWLNIEYGIGLEVNHGDAELTGLSYATIYSNELKEDSVYVQGGAGIRFLNDKTRAVTTLKALIHKAIERAIKSDISKVQINKLQRFKRNLN